MTLRQVVRRKWIGCSGTWSGGRRAAARVPLFVGLIVVMLAGTAGSVAAQQSPVLRAGARVRIWGAALPDSGLDARLLKIERDTVHVHADSALPRLIPVGQIRRFEMSRGRDPWLMIGVPALGTVMGALLGPALLEDDRLCEIGVGDERKCAKETSDTVVGAGAGFIIAEVLVAAFAKERWVALPIEELAVRFDPGSARVQLLVAVTFR